MPLVFDYAWPKTASVMSVLPYAVPILLAVAGTIYGVWRRNPAAIFGVWPLLILSVTCTVLPIADLANEYRMYLPLAGIIAAWVFGAVEIWRRLSRKLRVKLSGLTVRGASLAAIFIGLVVLLGGVLTLMRNQDYKSEMALWADTVV